MLLVHPLVGLMCTYLYISRASDACGGCDVLFAALLRTAHTKQHLTRNVIPLDCGSYDQRSSGCMFNIVGCTHKGKRKKNREIFVNIVYH